MEQKPDNRAKAIIFTVLLHVLLGAILIFGIEFSDYRPLSGPKVDIIEAEIVTAPPAKPRMDPAVEQRRLAQEEEAKRKQAAEEQEREREQAAREQAKAEEKRKLEQETARKAEVERKRKEAEKAAQDAIKKSEEAKAQAEAKRKAEQEAQKKAELAAKEKAEEERKRKQAEEAQRKAEAEQQAREKQLQEMLAQEQRERELNPQRNAYIAAISSKIAANWLKPPGISSDLKCEVLVNQMPDGSVTSARITKSSGNATFDDSVIKAIYKAAPLPLAPSPEVFDRELNVAFCSTGNLC